MISNENLLKGVDWTILLLGPVMFTMGQLFTIYVNILSYGELVFCLGLGWSAFIVGVFSLTTSAFLIMDKLLPLRKDLQRKIEKPF